MSEETVGLREAAQRVLDECAHGSSGHGAPSLRALEKLRAALEREHAPKPLPVPVDFEYDTFQRRACPPQTGNPPPDAERAFTDEDFKEMAGAAMLRDTDESGTSPLPRPWQRLKKVYMRLRGLSSLRAPQSGPDAE